MDTGSGIMCNFRYFLIFSRYNYSLKYLTLLTTIYHTSD